MSVSSKNGVRCLLAAAGFMALLSVAPAFPAGDEGAFSEPPGLAWWRAARFGMFIHWGPVSLKGTEIGWSRGREVPKEEYDRLYARFDPEGFDAEAWVRLAKAAGMKYLVITSKHHDGFCLWPSKYTDYHIGKTPFGRDVLAELASSCRKEGIRFCTYYSILDWHHPDYPTDSPGGKKPKPHPNMARYFQYVKNQTRELVENYGPLGVMWFDGQWEKPWSAAYGEELYAFLKGLQPDLVINNRVGKRRSGAAGTARHGGGNPGDFDTPEQRIGAFDRKRPWETCMTLCRQWAWKPGDEMKSIEKCLHSLLRTVGGDGNFLFNVGPEPSGRIEPRQAARLREMGAWLKRYGEGVYGTRGGPFKPGPWGASTCKGKKVYLFVMKTPAEGPLRLPDPGVTVRSARFLEDGAPASVRAEDGGLLVEIPPERRDPIAAVVVLDLDRRAFDVPPVKVIFQSGSLAFGKKATASNVYRNQADFAPEKAVDDDPATRWATDAGVHKAWLEVNLGAPKQVGRAYVDECVRYGGPRVKRFELRCRNGPAEPWRTVFSGTTLGRKFEKSFSPVTARFFRLDILEATDGPTLWEYRLFPPGR